MSPPMHIDIQALSLPEGLLPHPEGFREALTRHLERLLAHAGLGEADLQLDAVRLTLPRGLDTERAALQAAIQIFDQLTRGRT